MMHASTMALLPTLAILLVSLPACAGVESQPGASTKIDRTNVEREAQGGTATLVERTDESDAGPIRLDTAVKVEPTTLDPSSAADPTARFFIEQMFVGLTDVDDDGNVIPQLATEWTASEDDLVWTFKLGEDIHWVRRDATTGDFQDLGPVTAGDVVYGVLRSLDPNSASDDAYLLYPLVGAEAYHTVEPDASNFDALKAAVGVAAPDDTTVKFTLQEPAAYLPAILALPIAYPLPQTAIEWWGDNWTEAGMIVTNGPYTLRQWDHNSEIWLEKNPLWVAADDTQIELFGGPIVQAASTAMAMYENNQIDMMADPGWRVQSTELDRIETDPQLSRELLFAPQQCTYYYGFVTSKPPFDDVRMRTAFAAAIDRHSLIDNVVKGHQQAAYTFVPPGVFGNVVGDSSVAPYWIDDSYSEQVEEAQKLLESTGYPEGEGLDILLMHNTAADDAQIAQAIQSMWQDAFPKAKITIDSEEWPLLVKTLSTGSPDEEKPNIFRLSWCGDYPDASSWLNKVFHSESGQNYAKYNNPEFDRLVTKAASNPDLDKRQRLYEDAELFLGADTAIAPIFYFSYPRLDKPWLTPTGGSSVADWRIDWEDKLAARGE
jgi:oligopeptide transport system substrate-binding protein